jgi:23S rRNA-/tRNA-specific pseudouridylate synthase
VDRPIKDERGVVNTATTYLKFIAGHHDEETGARASLVLARPTTGRWHQIRRHLNGLSHPILGDTSHGSSQTNRQWRNEFDLPYERTCLHLARVQLPPTNYTSALDVACPIYPDMFRMLFKHLPKVLEDAKDELEAEGVILPTKEEMEAFEEAERVAQKQKHESLKDMHDPVKILDRSAHYVVAAKPAGVVCHNSRWSTSTSSSSTKREEHVNSTPMLQRVRNVLVEEGEAYGCAVSETRSGVNVNLIHRLDQSASGCLLLSVGSRETEEAAQQEQKAVTTVLMEALQSEDAVKTYVAITVGDTVTPEDIAQGWFEITSPVKDEHGKLRENSSTLFKFVAGNEKAGIVLARPKTGRWHQIRQHLRQRYHPILGDTSHGYSRTNREWKKLPEHPATTGRTYLHLASINVPETEWTPAISAACPIPVDMQRLLNTHLPDLLPDLYKALKESHKS